MVSFKLVYQEDIRKISLENLTITTLYSNVQNLFKELSNVSFESLYFHYFDDEMDKIRIVNDSDLEEAQRCHQHAVLKIFVQTHNNVPQFPAYPTLSSQLLTSSAFNFTPPSIPSVSSSTSIPSLSTSPTPTNPLMTSGHSLMGLLSKYLPPINTASTSTGVGIDAFTETPLYDSFTQMTQTQLNPSQTTQTHVPAITTQTTQTASLPPTSTHTHTQTLAPPPPTSTHTQTLAPLPIPTQTTQTQTHLPVATQTPQEKNPLVDLTTQTAQTQPPLQAALPYVRVESEVQAISIPATSELVGVHVTPGTPEVVEEVPSADSQSEPSPCAEEKAANVNSSSEFVGTAFGNLLQQLEEFGFTDKSKCARVLAKHGGNLEAALDELLTA